MKKITDKINQLCKAFWISPLASDNDNFYKTLIEILSELESRSVMLHEAVKNHQDKFNEIKELKGVSNMKETCARCLNEFDEKNMRMAIQWCDICFQECIQEYESRYTSPSQGVELRLALRLLQGQVFKLQNEIEKLKAEKNDA